MPILDEVTNHLMICKENDLHTVKPCASHDGVEMRQILYYQELHILGDRTSLYGQYNVSQGNCQGSIESR